MEAEDRCAAAAGILALPETRVISSRDGSHMKIQNLLFGLSPIVAIVLMASAPASASPSEKVLYAFRGAPGGCPVGKLVFDDSGNLFGSTSGCGETDATVFEMSPNGDGTWSLVTLFDELASSNLTFGSDGNLYGTSTGGQDDPGRIIELVRGGDGQWTESVLYSFDGYNGDGSRPTAGVVFDRMGNMYGTTQAGGANGLGAVFELTPSGSGTWTESLLRSFSGIDGSTPLGGVIVDSAGQLYGTTSEGGRENLGVVFELQPAADGWTEIVLHSFGNNSGTDGAYPMAGLTVDSVGSFYGTTSEGGLRYGTVFSLSQTGGSWVETVLHRFNPLSGDGMYPNSSLTIDSAGRLYGVVTLGGEYNYGIAYRLVRNKDGQWVESGRYAFEGGVDAGYPVGSLTFGPKGGIFGASTSGGLPGCGGYPDGCGTIFEIK